MFHVEQPLPIGSVQKCKSSRHSPNMPAPRTIQGVYRHGRVDLAEAPTGVDEVRVLVVFLDADTAAADGNGPPRAAPFNTRRTAPGDGNPSRHSLLC